MGGGQLLLSIRNVECSTDILKGGILHFKEANDFDDQSSCIRTKSYHEILKCDFFIFIYAEYIELILLFATTYKQQTTFKYCI
jgi:hypothetical protein